MHATATQATGRTTTLTYSVDAGGVPVYDAVVTQTVDTAISNAAMNFSGETTRGVHQHAGGRRVHAFI